MSTQPTLPDVIIDFCDVGPMEHHDSNLTFTQFLSVKYNQRGLGTIPDLLNAVTGDDFGGQIDAFVSAGRWMAQCVTCRAAVIACRHQPYFMCPGCGNRPAQKWVKVVFPDDIESIDAELLAIPGFRTNAPGRNWRAPVLETQPVAALEE